MASLLRKLMWLVYIGITFDEYIYIYCSLSLHPQLKQVLSHILPSLQNASFLCVCEPHPFHCSWSCESIGAIFMVFNYMEVLVYHSFTHQGMVVQRF